MDDELKQFLTQIAEHQDARMDKMDARLEAMESPVEARARGSRDIVHALELEVDLLKDRVRKLEGEHPTQ